MTAKNCDKELRYFGRLGEITEDNINEMIAYLLNDEGVIIGSVSASKQEECAEIFVSEEMPGDYTLSGQTPWKS